MKKSFLAHIAEDGREQTVLAHLQGTAELSAQFASSFGQSEQGNLAGLAHDIGKYSLAFQRRLAGASIKVDHATAGALECLKAGQPFAAFAVAGHHGGLPDGGGQGDTEGSFWGRINKAQRGLLEDYSAWQAEASLPKATIPGFSDQKEGMFFTRMLYSCLTDADFLNTETFMQNKARESTPTDTALLWERLQEYVSPWFPPSGKLNGERCAILRRCMEAGAKNAPGLFTLTVPTGGGKTVASLAFALSQAKEYGMTRIVYVIPYTSIIEQTADVFRKILGDENVLEHHAGVLFDIDDEADPNQIKRAQASENWDMPVIVTTAVQFFESLYANRSSKCRKLHNLAKSVIIFDEAQLLPLPYLRPCVFAISQLVKHYGASAVLCTATQPALDSIFAQYLPEHKATEICPPGIYTREHFRRVQFEKMGKMQWEEIAAKMRTSPQALCIVNTRKSAQKLFQLLGDNAFHLSTLMCPQHRRVQLAEIRRLLDEGLPCHVVSTSLIEAGVDVDFPTVFREEAGLDSILQAAGRCNREGKNAAQDSIVYIFRSEESPPPLFRRSISAGRYCLEHFADISAPEAVDAYFHELLMLSGEEAQDKQRILRCMETELFPFRQIAERFHLIESNTRTVYIPYQSEGEALVSRLRNGERNRNLFRRLDQCSVNIYENHFSALEAIGALTRTDDDLAILTDMAQYTEQTGLSLHIDSGQGLFI